MISSVERPTRSIRLPSISSSIRPAVGATRPTMHLMSVDLPLPLVPSSATVCPAPTSSETPCSTRTDP
jgi:hypothetical protein